MIIIYLLKYHLYVIHLHGDLSQVAWHCLWFVLGAEHRQFDHRITEQLRLEGNCGGPWSSRDTPRADCSGTRTGGFKSYLRRRLAGQLVPMLCSLYSTECFLMVRGKLLCSSLCPLLLVPVLGTTEKGLGPSSLRPPCR